MEKAPLRTNRPAALFMPLPEGPRAGRARDHPSEASGVRSLPYPAFGVRLIKPANAGVDSVAHHHYYVSGGNSMISWAITFFIIALIAAVLGFSGIAGAAANIAWILAIIGIILAIVFFVSGRRPRL